MAEKTRAHIFVSGRVQGVFFRQNAKEKADELGLFGWVKNLQDGRVEAVFEGEKEKMEKMIAWLRIGPPPARIDSAEINWQEYKDEFADFKIR